MADKAQRDLEQALTSLQEHPGWNLLVNALNNDYTAALNAMTANPQGKVWDHGVQRGIATKCMDVIGYPAKVLKELRDIEEARMRPDMPQEEDEED
jgi:hypothetical protein